MTGPIKNMLVGIFVLGAIAIAVVMILFLKPSVGDGKQTLFVRFSDIQNLSPGTRVLFAGKPIGEVESITQIPDARQQPTDELGRVYFFQLKLKIDSQVKVYNTDEIAITTSGLMGEKSISITPKAPPMGVTAKRITNQPIYANSVDMIQNAMVDFSDLAASMEGAFNQVRDWIKAHGDSLASTIESGGRAMDQIDVAVAAYNESDVISDVKKSVEAFGDTFNQLGEAIAVLDEHGTFENIGVAMRNLRSASQNIDQITEDVVDGKGTLGKLIVDNDLYLQASAVMTKASNLMSAINNYGLMFHLNKQWQRTHTQRVQEINAISSPTAFKTYFQGEIEGINSSIDRIAMLIQKTEDQGDLIGNKEFCDDFTKMLSQVDQLSDTLRLYNQHLNEE